MSSVSSVARMWQAAGVSTIPILPNGTKRPATRWQEFQGRVPSIDEVERWWGNGVEYGLALIMGKISGNLEMLEIEGKAMTGEMWPKVTTKMEELGLAQIFDTLMVDGYTEESPSGGLHLIYHISDHPVPGNEKIARRPATPEELAQNPLDKVKVLAETRGEGGYVIVAPSPGLCHPSGKQWVKLFGEYGHVASITWEEREAVHAAIREALDEMPVPVAHLPVPVDTTSFPGIQAGTGSRPGDDWAEQTDWDSLLRSDGWTYSHQTGEESYWVRPGKSRRDGHSATLNYQGSNLLKVFSSSVEGLDQEATYTKFGYLAATRYGGDHSRASQALSVQGFGRQAEVLDLDSVDLLPGTDLDIPQEKEKYFNLDEVGNSQRLFDRVRGRFYWVEEEKCFRVWSGKAWERNVDGAATREWIKITEEMMKSPDEAIQKWGRASRSTTRVRNAVSLMKDLPGCTQSAEIFDQDLGYLNVENGLLDLESGELLPHDPAKLITRTFGTAFDPQATCPNFDRFMEQVLPDNSMRSYVQRALGYSLLGTTDQRSLFIIHGPSGTGKSTLMETMRAVFGEYGVTAPAGTFKNKGPSQGPNNDLHRLKGRRFVTTSETTESALFEEDLLKRMTGDDTVQTRALYENYQEWKPQCVIWMATNHPPRFTSDDNAIWKRVKLVPFLTQFEGETLIPGLARKMLIPEAAGILNWLLAGLKAYQENGLDMPQEVSEAADQLRLESDPVIRFIEEQLSEGVLVEGEDFKIRTVELHRMYLEWARLTGETRIGNRRFTNRLNSGTEFWVQKTNGLRNWVGLGRGSGVGVLGTIFT